MAYKALSCSPQKVECLVLPFKIFISQAGVASFHVLRLSVACKSCLFWCCKVLVSLVARQYPRNQSCELLWPVFCFLEAVFVSQWLCHVSFFCQVTCLRCAYIIVSLWQLFTCEQECYFLVSFLNRMLCPTSTEFTLILCLHLMVKYCQQNLFQAHVSYH